jgi:DNA-binding response OmpR family regulator
MTQESDLLDQGGRHGAGAGAEVAIAPDVERAVCLARERMPGAVFLDLGLPEADLAALVGRLREAAGDVPVIAYGPHVDRDRFAAASAAAAKFSPRPFQFQPAGIDPEILGVDERDADDID